MAGFDSLFAGSERRLLGAPRRVGHAAAREPGWSLPSRRPTAQPPGQDPRQTGRGWKDDALG